VALGPRAQATTTERVVTNRFSGLAIEGYDPLTYFVDGDPQVGLPAFEAVQSRRRGAHPVPLHRRRRSSHRPRPI